MQEVVLNSLPTTRHEEWKYTSLRSLSQRPFKILDRDTALADSDRPLPLNLEVRADEVTVRFHNGYPLQVPNSAAAEVVAKDAPQVAKSLAEVTRWSEITLEQVTRGYTESGVAVRAADPNTIKRVTVVHELTSAADGALMAPLHVYELAERCFMEVTEFYVGDATDAFLHATSVAHLAAGSCLKVTRVQVGNSNSSIFSNLFASVDKDAALKTFGFDAGAKLVRNNLAISIKGGGAEIDVDGVYLAGAHQHVDSRLVIDHLVGHSRSNQRYKGIVRDHGRAVFTGKIIVRKDAQQTSAFQLNRNLLLGINAEVDTKPELMIDADDVKCSHGATIGRLDEDELFYLMSRGIRRADAERMLSRAYIADLIDKNSDERTAAVFANALATFFGDA